MDRILFICGLLFVGGAVGADEKVEPTSRQVLKAIELFAADPLSDRGKDMSKVIVIYATQSKDLKVVIAADLLPWIGTKHGRTLMVAFIAGNTRSQIETGVFRDDPYSGLLLVFRVYARLKEEDESLKLDSIEEQIAAHKEGKLHQHIASLEKHRNKDDSSEE